MECRFHFSLLPLALLRLARLVLSRFDWLSTITSNSWTFIPPFISATQQTLTAPPLITATALLLASQRPLSAFKRHTMTIERFHHMIKNCARTSSRHVGVQPSSMVYKSGMEYAANLSSYAENLTRTQVERVKGGLELLGGFPRRAMPPMRGVSIGGSHRPTGVFGLAD